MMIHHPQRHILPLLYLVLLASIASFAAIIPTPALPAIGNYFNINASTTEMVMSVYLFGYAIGQLLYGPLANRYGRKQAAYLGVTVAIIANLIGLISPLTHCFTLLIISRFLTAAGAACGIVVTMIMIKDCYSGIQARQTFANVVLAFAVVPFVATALGGILTHHCGWEATIVLTLIYMLVLVYVIRRLSETLPQDKRVPISMSHLLNAYQQLFTHWGYLRLVLIYTFAASASYLFNALAPIIVIKNLHVSTQIYGWLSIIPALGMFMGGSLSSRLATRLSAQTLIISGIGLIFLSGVLLTLLFSLQSITLISLYLLATVMMCGVTLISPNASMQALSQVDDHANATSLMNALVLGITSILVAIAGHFMDVSIMTFALAFLMIGVISLLLFLLSTTKAAQLIVIADKK